MLKLQRNTETNLYANFLDIENKEGVSIVDPKITIRHVDSGGTTIVDVNEQPMSLAVETLYYFKWVIPNTADLGFYTVEYEATIDGEYAEANESFEVTEFEGDEICEEFYTTKEKVAAYLGVTSDKIEDDWLEWTSRYIETYTCQKFCPATTTEKYDIERLRESTLILDNYPILELQEVKNDGTIMPLNDIAVYEDEGVLKIKDSFITSSSKILESGFFARGIQTVIVTYKYGYSSVPKEIEWAATVLASSIASSSLTSTGTISGGAVIEEEIGEYRVRRSPDATTTTDFSSAVEGSKDINDRLEEDVFSAKNVLRMYRDRKMRSV